MSVLFDFYTASKNSLRSTFPGATSIRRGSLASELHLVNSYRLEPYWGSPISRFSWMHQCSPVDFHSRWPDGEMELLTYTHSCFSVSVVGTAYLDFSGRFSGVGIVVCVGLWVLGVLCCERVGGVCRFGFIVCGGLLGEV